MPQIEIPSIVITLLQVLLAFSGAFIFALWISLVVWTFRDARSRSRDIFAIILATLMVVIFGPLGLVLYFLLRPPITLAELYERSLEEEALLQDIEDRPRCPGCSRVVNETWVICPDCHTQLKKNCPSCDQVLELNWSICPFCAVQVETPIFYQDSNSPPGQEMRKPSRTPSASTAAQAGGRVKPARGQEVQPPMGQDKTRPNAPQVGQL